MSKGTPKVTVMMPVHNAEKYLARSIQSALGQNFSSFELIIYDDGSSDGSYDIAEKFSRRDSRIRLLRSRINRGVSYARNKILWAARGKYIAPQDADDIMMQGRLKDLAHFLDTHSSIGVVFGCICSFGGGKKYNRFFVPWVRLDNGTMYLRNAQRVRTFPWFHHGASMFRRAAAIGSGGYDCRLKTSEDVDFFFRLFKRTQFFYLNNLYYMHRFNHRGISTRHHAAVAKRHDELKESYKCEVLKIGPFRIRIFFNQNNFYQEIKRKFIKGSLLRVRKENTVSKCKRNITFQIKKTTSYERGLDREILFTEIAELRGKSCFGLVENRLRAATVYCLPKAEKKLPPEAIFEQYFMKPLQIIMASCQAAAGRGALVSKNANGVLILAQKGSNDNWTIPFLTNGYKYLSHNYVLFQINNGQLAGYGFPTRIPIRKHERKQVKALGNTYWDKSRKKYYLEPKAEVQKPCLIKTVIFSRRSSKKHSFVKRLPRADFKRRLMAEKFLCGGDRKKIMLFLLLKQAKAYEIAYKKENLSQSAEQILLNINRKST